MCVCLQRRLINKSISLKVSQRHPVFEFAAAQRSALSGFVVHCSAAGADPVGADVRPRKARYSRSKRAINGVYALPAAMYVRVYKHKDDS